MVGDAMGDRGLPIMSGTKTPHLIGRPSGGRKLIAVVHADMVGYSRLIGLDDVETLERLGTLRRTLIDPTIDEHGGRIVNTAGDSLLIVFESVDSAVRCAVQVQQHVPVCDGDQPPDRTIRFRVGINVGDVIPDGLDVHGDVVNVAARLQSECPPGGICVSRAVRDHIGDRLGLAFEELGALNLKNISRPVEVFVLTLNTVATAPKPVDRSLIQDMSDSLPLPDRPSIAVLAFTNMGDDPEQEFFSDGIAEDITTELARSRSLFVIARNSSFTYKGRAIDIRQVARELGVRYVVEGSVRHVAGQTRITVQLIDASTNTHIWSERYDRDVEHVFAVQREIAEAVAGAIFPAVGDQERRRAIRKPPSSLSAWETYQRGLWHFFKLVAVENVRARHLFVRAAEFDPGFSSPHVGLSETYLWDGLLYGTRPVAEAAKLAGDEARKAIAIDSNDAAAQGALASAFVLIGNYQAGLDRVERALALNRNSATAYRVKGSALILTGRYSDGRVDAFTSLRLNPRDPISGFTESLIAASYYLEGNYEASLETIGRCMVQYPEFARVRRYLVAALGQLGRREEAATALSELLAIAPHLPDMLIRNRPSYLRPEDHEHILDGLRKAGWQG
jgi:adenylate cyclase